jgi:hypothetical protein
MATAGLPIPYKKSGHRTPDSLSNSCSGGSECERE